MQIYYNVVYTIHHANGSLSLVSCGQTLPPSHGGRVWPRETSSSLSVHICINLNKTVINERGKMKLQVNIEEIMKFGREGERDSLRERERDVENRGRES